ADPAPDTAGAARAEDCCAAPRQKPEASNEWAEPQPALKELRHEEDGAHQCAGEKEHRGIAGREITQAEQAHWNHRVSRAQLPQDEHQGQQRARPERPGDLGAAPARCVATDEAPYEAEGAGGREHRAKQVDRRLYPERHTQPDESEDGDGQAEWQVHPEDPAPAEALGDHATDGRAEDRREASDTTVNA